MNYGPQQFTSIDRQLADETIGIALDARGAEHITFTVQGNGTTSSGVVTIEEAVYDPLKDPVFTGTWSTITTVNASDVTGGQQKAVHLATGTYGFVRPRISTVIGGTGTVSVFINAD